MTKKSKENLKNSLCPGYELNTGILRHGSHVSFQVRQSNQPGGEQKVCLSGTGKMEVMYNSYFLNVFKYGL